MTESQKIAKLNDTFRQSLQLFMLMGQVVTTASIASLPDEDKTGIFEKVVNYNTFTHDNDPYGEHDFGSFKHNSESIFWKIDYYDLSLEWGSEDPSDPNKTRRVMTIMFAHEY